VQERGVNIRSDATREKEYPTENIKKYLKRIKYEYIRVTF
jgi:hypothetical protein